MRKEGEAFVQKPKVFHSTQEKKEEGEHGFKPKEKVKEQG